MTSHTDAQTHTLGQSMAGFPANWQIDRMTPPELVQIQDVTAATRRAIDNPLASMPLADLCGPGTRVCVAVDVLAEAQRSALQAILLALFDNGVAAEDITVLTPAATVDVDLPVAVIVHDPDDVRTVNDLGTYEGVPIQVNHYAAEADLLLGLSASRLEAATLHTGSDAIVTNHLSTAATQAEFRSARYLDDALRQQAAGDGLYDRVLREGARRAGLVFVVDMLLDDDARVIAVCAGAPQAVNRELTMISHSARDTSTIGAYDIVIADPGTDSLYRASQAAIHIGLAPDSALQRGGVLVLPMLTAPAAGGETPARTPEAAGFYEALANGADSEEVIQLLARRALSPGEDRAYLLAHVMQRNPIIAVGLRDADQPRHVISVRNITEAAELAETFIGHRPRTLFLPRALSAVPVNTRTAPLDDSNGADDAVVDELLRDLDI